MGIVEVRRGKVSQGKRADRVRVKVEGVSLSN